MRVMWTNAGFDFSEALYLAAFNIFHPLEKYFLAFLKKGLFVPTKSTIFSQILHEIYCFFLNPSESEATLVQRTKTQSFFNAAAGLFG